MHDSYIPLPVAVVSASMLEESAGAISDGADSDSAGIVLSTLVESEDSEDSLFPEVQATKPKKLTPNTIAKINLFIIV